MTTSSPEPEDDARNGAAASQDANAGAGDDTPAMPRDPYVAPPAEGPLRQPEPYGQGPGGHGEPLGRDGGGWRPSPRNGYGIAALVLGIVSILLFPGPGIILGVLGIIFGILGLRLISKGEATNTGMAITGIVLSAIGLTLGALLVGFAAKYWPKIDDCLDEDKFPTSQQREDCVKDKLPDWATND
jgi:Domain of unknown function (DUF4190)